jgi:hypothetical protein
VKPVARIGLSMLAVALGGCGSAGSATPPTSSIGSPGATLVSHVSLRTSSGVRYAAELRIQGKQECLFQTYGVLGAHLKPFQQTSRSCASTRQPVGPTLIRVVKPSTAFILDRPDRGCGQVRLTPAGQGSRVADVRCSTTKPTLRLTPLPPTTSLTVAGIVGVRQIVLSHERCAQLICSHVLTAPGGGG